MSSDLLSTTSFVPVVKFSEASFFQYLKQIQKFPILTPEQEYQYGIAFQERGDASMAKFLVQSHLRLVAKMATKFRTYGLPIADLVSEGNIGLIQAVKKFDPRKGFRLATYAIWWIKAYIQEYILRSWSLVKIGTTAAQRKLFFNLHKIKRKIRAASEGELSNKHVNLIAESLNVSEREVIDMNSRLQNSDSSLNQIIGNEQEGDEMGDIMVCSRPNQEQLAISRQEKDRQIYLLNQAFSKLKDREKKVLKARLLSEKPTTLEELSQVYNVSRERIRQIQDGAIKKLRKELVACN